MKKESLEFCEFIERELNYTMDFSKWKEYLSNLPKFYKNDIAFKLLFDWHINAATGTMGEHSIVRRKNPDNHPIFIKQMQLIDSIGGGYGLGYQYRELVFFMQK